jgi:YHS domain-containing protein
MRRVLVLVALAVILLHGTARAEDLPLAIKGYDPVTYFTDSGPVLGREDLEYVLDGARYRFVSSENLQRFESDPDRYLPQFAGLCTVRLANDQRVEADPTQWIVRDGKLYLFASPVGKEMFEANPTGSIALAHANWTKLRP